MLSQLPPPPRTPTLGMQEPRSQPWVSPARPGPARVPHAVFRGWGWGDAHAPEASVSAASSGKPLAIPLQGGAHASLLSAACAGSQLLRGRDPGASSLRLQSPGGGGGPRPVPAPGTRQVPGRVSETLPRGLCRAPTARHAGRGRGPRRNPPDAGPCPPQGTSRPRAFRALSSVQVRAPQPDTRGRASSREQSHLPSGAS